MKKNFVTETIEEKIPLWLFCHPGLVRETLVALLAAADFEVTEPGGEKPFAIVVVQGSTLPQGIQSSLEGVPVYEVKFSSSGMGTQGATTLIYEQVFADVNPALSLLDELTRRLVFDQNFEIRGGECAPLLLEDVCEHITQTILAGRRQDNIFRGEKKISYTEFILNLRNQLKVPKGKKPKQVRVPMVSHTPIPSREIEAVIASLVSQYEPLRPVKETLVGKKVAKVMNHPGRRRVGSALLLGSFLFGLVFSGAFLWYRLSAGEVASRVRVLAYEATMPAVTTQTKQAMSQLDFLSGIKDFLLSWAHQGKASDLKLSIPLLRAVLEASGEVNSGRAQLLSAYRSFTDQEKGDTLALLRDADSKLESAYKNFSLVQARFVQHEVNLPQILGGKGVQEQLTAMLPQLRKEILELRSVVGAATLMLSEKHSYALLLLDDTKLRGSGGEVVSVAVVTVDSGKLLTTQIYPASVLNEMLTGEVQAPDEVRVYLKQNSWALPQATWDLPFSKSAERLSWFLGKELSRPIDGVITIPAKSLVPLIEASGPLSLGSGETVSSTGFETARLEQVSHLAQDTKALETWYNKVFSAVLDRLQHGEDKILTKLFPALKTQLFNSEMFVNVANQEAQRMFGALSWEGGVSTPTCPSTFMTASCRVSGALVLENTLGGNHANAFIERSHVHAIKIGEDVALHNRILTLTNTNTLLAWPHGSYQTLVKFMINEDAKVQSLTLDNQVLLPSQFSLVKSDDKLGVRVGVEVAPGATVRIKLLYTEPGIPKENSSLVFFEQKQPGAGEDPFTLILTYPDTYTPKALAPRGEVGRNSLTFTSKHDTNRLFGVGF